MSEATPGMLIPNLKMSCSTESAISIIESPEPEFQLGIEDFNLRTSDCLHLTQLQNPQSVSHMAVGDKIRYPQ